MAAGGYDALYLLTVDLPQAVSSGHCATAHDAVQSIWSEWSGLSVSPLRCVADSGGLQYHTSIVEVPGLKAALSDRSGLGYIR
jgi:hypothetical protein